MSELSPAAQAVLDAYKDALDGKYINGEWIQDEAGQVAAALRAAADQVVPEEPPASGGMRPGGTGALTLDEAQGFQRFATRKKLLTIATELENQ